MAISLSSLTRSGTVLKPPRVLAYGTHGIGKSSLAAGTPDPVFLQTEDGLGLIDVPTFGLLRSYGEIMEAIGALYTEDHKFKTVVLDTLDWTEPLVWAETARANNWANIEAPGYGKGYAAAQDVWRAMLDGFNALRDEKGMMVFFLAHCEVKRFESPESDPYDRYVIKLQQRASALVQEHVDAVLFANYRVSIVRSEAPGQKKGTGKARAVGGGQRVLYTAERPAFLAKNRFAMPDAIDLPNDPTAMWPTVAATLPYFNPAIATKAA